MALTRKSVVSTAVCLALLVGLAYAGHGHDHHHAETVAGVNIDNMSLEELDTQLQVSRTALPWEKTPFADINSYRHAPLSSNST